MPIKKAFKALFAFKQKKIFFNGKCMGLLDVSVS